MSLGLSYGIEVWSRHLLLWRILSNLLNLVVNGLKYGPWATLCFQVGVGHDIYCLNGSFSGFWALFQLDFDNGRWATTCWWIYEMVTTQYVVKRNFCTALNSCSKKELSCLKCASHVRQVNYEFQSVPNVWDVAILNLSLLKEAWLPFSFICVFFLEKKEKNSVWARRFEDKFKLIAHFSFHLLRKSSRVFFWVFWLKFGIVLNILG